MRVFVTGGTGLVGTRLVHKLQQRNDQVVLLTRRASTAREKFGGGVEIAEGDPMQPGAWMEALAGCEGVIHLAGENIFNRRWNADFKQLLFDSRIKSTANVVAALARNPRRADGSPKVLVNASAIGWYGAHGDEELTEESPPASDFLAQLCVEWEKAAHQAEKDGVRVALVRVGIVLDREGGALAKMLTPFKWFVGGKVSNGRQYMSWIHHEDMVGLFLLGLDSVEAIGPLNGTAPNPVTNKQFSKALGRALHRPACFPTPRFMLRLALGEVADVIATGQRVLPKRPQALGYQFRFPTIDEALADILR
jgi:uncharacterized protein (TIGR01777 family)